MRAHQDLPPVLLEIRDLSGQSSILQMNRGAYLAMTHEYCMLHVTSCDTCVFVIKQNLQIFSWHSSIAAEALDNHELSTARRPIYAQHVAGQASENLSGLNGSKIAAVIDIDTLIVAY